MAVGEAFLVKASWTVADLSLSTSLPLSKSVDSPVDGYMVAVVGSGPIQCAGIIGRGAAATTVEFNN